MSKRFKEDNDRDSPIILTPDAAVHSDKKRIDQGWDGQADAKFLFLGKARVNQAEAQYRDGYGCDK